MRKIKGLFKRSKAEPEEAEIDHEPMSIVVKNDLHQLFSEPNRGHKWVAILTYSDRSRIAAEEVDGEELVAKMARAKIMMMEYAGRIMHATGRTPSKAVRNLETRLKVGM